MQESEWVPPSYASAIEDDDEKEWKPPSYATIAKDEEKPVKKTSAFREAIVNPKPFKPSGLGFKPKSQYDTKETDEAIKLLEAEGKAPYDKKEEVAKKEEEPKKSGFVQGLKDIYEPFAEQVSKAGKSSYEHIKKGEYPQAFHDIVSPVIEPFEGITSAVRNVTQGKKAIEISPEQAKEEAKGQLIGLSGIPAERIKEALESGDYPRLGGQGLAAAGMLIGTHKIGKAFGGGIKPSDEKKVASEPSIRRNISKEKPYKFQGDLPSEEPSIRKPKDIGLSSDVTPEGIELNKKLAKDVAQSESDRMARIRGTESDLSPNASPRARETELERRKLEQEMYEGVERRKATEEVAPKEEAKLKFVNPFEKKLEEARTELPSELRTAEEATGEVSKPKIPDSEEAIFKNAQEKFNMGKELPKEEEWKPPSYAEEAPREEWKAPDYAESIEDKALIGQEGSLGPHNDMPPERLIQSVINGDKPAAILDNGGSNTESLVKYAKDNGLEIIDNPIVPDEPILAKDKATGEALVESLKNGDHETNGKLLGYSPEDIAKFKENLPGNEESPTLYHGTQNTVDKFDTTKNSPFANFSKMIHFSEDPKYSELFSLGESRGMKRDRGIYGNPNTIAAKVNAKNVLDLTKSNITKDELTKLQNVFPDLKNTDSIRSINSDYIKDMINSNSNIEIPFDAIKYKEHGATNWAVPTKTQIKSAISGVNLNKPKSLHPQLSGLQNYGNGILYLDFDSKTIKPEDVKALFPDKNVDVTQFITDKGQRFRIDVQHADESIADQLGNEIEQSVGGSFGGETELHGGLGGIGGGKNKPEPAKGPYGAALDKLFNAMGNIKESRVSQDKINKIERARRFAASAGVKEEGRLGAKKSLAAMKGEFEKADFDKLQLGRKETDSLFTAIKKARITEPEKVRGYSALFKILNGESLPQRNELALLDEIFGNGFAGRITELHGGIGAVGFKLAKTANTMKAMRSSIDMSAPLRQGIGLIHRPEYRDAFKEMFKYFGDKDYYDGAMQVMEKDPDYLKSREAGLFLAKHESVTHGEEAFANNYIGNFPKPLRAPVEASERAYVGFLNSLRFDTFKSLIKNAESMGHKVFDNVEGSEVPTTIAENIAKYINVSTGRGGLGRLERIAPEMNAVLWSPRLISSRLSILNPKYYTTMDTFTRREAIKSLFSIAAAGSTVTGLGVLAGGKTSLDPNNSDFMKARFGNNVLDPFAGFQQVVVAANRLISGTANNKPQTRSATLGNFTANKLSPMAALAYEIASAQKWTGEGNYVSRFGQKKNISNEVVKSFAPMFIQDVTDVFQNDPSFAEQVGLDTASLFGMGVQNYPENKPKSAFRRLRP